MRKILKEIVEQIEWLNVAVIVAVILFWVVVAVFISGIRSNASGPGYERIEQTENQTVIEITEKVAEKYPICPELLQAIVFYESSNRSDAVNNGCIGYMQVNERYHSERMDKLGVSDLWDGYSNILTGTDYLFELCETYNDVAAALMVYHGEKNAVAKAEAGEISGYAEKILDLSARLEKLHGK